MHRRYLATLKLLATMRKLAAPATIQVNLAEWQVNQQVISTSTPG
jgi:hypothetical protein